MNKNNCESNMADALELKRFKEELSKKEAMLADYTDHLKRLQAEFENYCKRVEKERAILAGMASERIIVKLLLVIDDFERAMLQLKEIPETSEIATYNLPETKKGIELIFKSLHKLLDEERVEPIVSVGAKFDPYKHEVVMQVESDNPEDTIIEEVQKGYMLNGRVIRYSKVKVSKGNGGKNG